MLYINNAVVKTVNSLNILYIISSLSSFYINMFFSNVHFSSEKKNTNKTLKTL